MSENEMIIDDAATEVVDELSLLKERATQLGIKFHHNVGLDKLRKMVNKALSGDDEDEEEVQQTQEVKETEGQRRARLLADATRLVRVNVYPKDPLKTDYDGEIYTVSNSIVGTVRKFVKFNTENGWHVPKIIVDMLKEKELQRFRTKKLPNGSTHREGYTIKAFEIVELPPLTETELKKLAAEQAARGSITSE